MGIKLTIIDDIENEYSFEEWKSLEIKEKPRFIKVDDGEVCFCISMYWKNYEPLLKTVRWSNVPSWCLEGMLSTNGYENCLKLIDVVNKKKIKDYNEGKDHLWADNNYTEAWNCYHIDKLLKEINTWQDYLPALGNTNYIREEINGKVAQAYIPSTTELNVLRIVLDKVNDMLEYCKSYKILTVCEDGTKIPFWSSNEDYKETAKYFYVGESGLGALPLKAPKYDYKYVFPMFKILR